jgi:Tfp pilus assembly protein PilF
MLRYLKQVLQGDEADGVKFYQAIFSINAQGDLWRMADLTPESPAAVTKAVMFELMASAFQIGKSGLVHLADGELWNQLPESRRQSIRRGLTRLENLGQGGNKTVAASALEFLGGLQWMLMRDLTGSESNLRRALALDPARELAWNLLMGLLVGSERFPDALAAAESRLKIKETARNHVAAAKVCDKLDRPDKARLHTDAAVKLDPDGYLANLSAAVVILKRGTTDNSIQQARQLLEHAGNAKGHPASQDEWVEWNLTRGIFYALGDDPAAARRDLKRVLEADPANETAKQALAIVGN